MEQWRTKIVDNRRMLSGVLMHRVNIVGEKIKKTYSVHKIYKTFIVGFTVTRMWYN